MLSKPNIGWSVFTLGEFQTEVSYLVDIPFDWLRACISGLKYNIPFSFFLEEEGSNCIVTAYWDYTHIIIQNEDVTLKTIKDADWLDLSYMLLVDIKRYFDDWVNWYAFEQTESDFLRRRIELKELIEETEQILYITAKKQQKSFAEL